MDYCSCCPRQHSLSHGYTKVGLDNSFGNMGVNSCYLFVHGSIRFHSSFSQLLVSVIFIFFYRYIMNCVWNLIYLVLGRTIHHLISSRTYWLTILLITVLALLPRFMYKVIWQIFWPSDIQIAIESEILGKVHNDLGSKPEQDVS